MEAENATRLDLAETKLDPFLGFLPKLRTLEIRPSGCGAVGRAAASECGDQLFEYRHHLCQFYPPTV